MSDQIPPEYLATVRAMVEHLQNVLAVVDERPLFRLPPVGLRVVATLDQVPAVAVNSVARQLVESFLAIGRSIRPDGEPTLLMLSVALEFAGVPVERVPLDVLGIRLVGRKGRPS